MTDYYKSLPLEEFSKSVPPGWDPSQAAKSPWRAYFEKMKLWFRLQDSDDPKLGALAASRLKGQAWKVAVKLRLPKHDFQRNVIDYDVGDAALTRLATEIRDTRAGSNTIMARRCFLLGRVVWRR